MSSVDVSDVLAGLESLKEIRTHVARSMAVAGGKLVRDEAKVRAPVKTGRLRDAIYLAYKDGKSNEAQVLYSVTWNSKRAPHGHLVEFGHWSVHGGRLGKGGVQGEWVPAKPFLRPAFDTALPQLQEVMVARGRDRLAELLREKYVPADEEFV